MIYYIAFLHNLGLVTLLAIDDFLPVGGIRGVKFIRPEVV